MKITTRLPDTQTESLTNLIHAFVERWNRKDLMAFGALFTEDAEFTDVVGQIAIGQEAIIEQHEFPFKVVLKDAQLELDDLYFRAIGPAWVMCSAKWRVTGSQTPKGDMLPPRHGSIQFILTKESEWKIALVHNSDFALPFEQKAGFLGKPPIQG
ncbi:SgcJ/EcaC family oxidoreductase [Pontibacter sp. G13]|uniref:YybH family protein n=1 Tax=Pontibacter sp. G13 TaxID=3074898 RepID=UPI00288956D1|nr:SgcJ/EcaC family oxidoreductase [Pontibacter sp. G13]WNJ20088.1 SgcJ/EcaC family oxidoreductase [Pontibacter sp. G13]